MFQDGLHEELLPTSATASVPRSAQWHGQSNNLYFYPTRLTHVDQLPALRGRPVRVYIQPGSTHASHALPPQQFQALFNSLFKGLFIFPSRYLFAIGLLPVFSLRRDVPPNLGWILNQPDSAKASREETKAQDDGVLTLSDVPFQGT